MSIKIIDYEPRYRDDMLFCYLSAKDALGKYAPEGHRAPMLREDLLNIESHYLEKGDRFWLAVDADDRVVGTLGVAMLNAHESRLKRLFIKPELKRGGIGGKLMSHAEDHARQNGITKIYTRFANWYPDAERFYAAKGFVYKSADRHLITMVKEI